MRTIHVYSFDNGEGDGESPTFTTTDAREAREYAKRHHLMFFNEEYELVSRSLVWDYRPIVEIPTAALIAERLVAPGRYSDGSVVI